MTDFCANVVEDIRIRRPSEQEGRVSVMRQPSARPPDVSVAVRYVGKGVLTVGNAVGGSCIRCAATPLNAFISNDPVNYLSAVSTAKSGSFGNASQAGFKPWFQRPFSPFLYISLTYSLKKELPPSQLSN